MAVAQSMLSRERTFGVVRLLGGVAHVGLIDWRQHPMLGRFQELDERGFLTGKQRDANPQLESQPLLGGLRQPGRRPGRRFCDRLGQESHEMAVALGQDVAGLHLLREEFDQPGTEVRRRQVLFQLAREAIERRGRALRGDRQAEQR
jgi:hypothetical protein